MPCAVRWDQLTVTVASASLISSNTVYVPAMLNVNVAVRPRITL